MYVRVTTQHKACGALHGGILCRSSTLVVDIVLVVLYQNMHMQLSHHEVKAIEHICLDPAPAFAWLAIAATLPRF